MAWIINNPGFFFGLKIIDFFVKICYNNKNNLKTRGVKMKERNDLIYSEEFLRSVSLHKKNILISFRNFLIFWTLFSFVSGLVIYYFSGQTITIKEILFFFLLGTVLVGISTVCRYLSKYKVLEITITDKKRTKMKMVLLI